MKPKILLLHIRLPEFDRCSGDLRLTNLLQILARFADVSVHVLYKEDGYLSAPENSKYVTLLRGLGIEVTAGGLAARLGADIFDAVIIEFWYVAGPILEQLRVLQPQARLIVDSEHVYFYSDQHRLAVEGKDANAPEVLERKQRELDAYRRADLTITTTDEDGRVLQAEDGSLRTHAVPNIHPIPDLPSDLEALRASKSILFVGNFSNNPSNVDAMQYFCGSIFPIVRRTIPDAKLWIVGNAPPPEVRALACESVEVTGYVPDTAPYLLRSRVSICPLRFGAGLKGKIGEAMMYALPVVTTSIGTQGMSASIGRDLLVADAPEEFAARVIEVLKDPALYRQLSAAGRALVTRRYSPAAVESEVRSLVEGLGTIPVQRLPLARAAMLRMWAAGGQVLERHLLWRLRKSA